ncbi:MAG: isochorismatase family protein [Nitrolancea sp.]
MTTKRAGLLLVDVQNDFCPGGALAVEHGDSVVASLNDYSERFQALQLPIYASRDWHPARSKHFKEYGGAWPAHCVQGSRGAEFRSDLHLPASDNIITKGDSVDDEGYSPFDGHLPVGERFAERLTDDGVTQLYVGGLATDYCVRASALDARKHGLEVVLLMDAVRGVDVKPGDSERAIQEMRAAGVETMTLETLDLS